MCIDIRVCVCVGVCNKFGISVYSPISQRVSPSINGKVSLAIDSKREEHAHVARLSNQRGSVYFDC